MEHESDSDTNFVRSTRYNIKMIGAGTKGRAVHLNKSNIVISQNTKKSPRDLRRLAVKQTPVKNSQMSKILRKYEMPRHIVSKCNKLAKRE